MKNLKFIIVLFIVLFLQNICNAENWEYIGINNKKVFIDTDSVNCHNGSIYYNVKYEDPNGELVVVTIQSRNEKVGIVAIYKNSEYIKNKPIADTLTTKEAANFQSINEKSLLYNANTKAKNIISSKILFEEINTNTSDNNVDYQLYMKKMQKKIKKNWHPPRENNRNKVVVLFKITKAGELLDIKIINSSGSKEMEEAAIKAIQLTAPFDPLPDKCKEDSVDINFTFDYKILFR